MADFGLEDLDDILDGINDQLADLDSEFAEITAALEDIGSEPAYIPPRKESHRIEFETVKVEDFEDINFLLGEPQLSVPSSFANYGSRPLPSIPAKSAPKEDDVLAQLEKLSNDMNAFDPAEIQRQKDIKIQQAMAKLQEANIKKLNLRIYIEDYKAFKTVTITSLMETENVIADVLEKAHLAPDPTWTLFECDPDHGIERPLIFYDKITDVVWTWEVETTNILMLKKYPDKAKLNLVSIQEEFPRMSGVMYFESKGKWSKRYFEFKLSGMYHYKDTKLSQETFLCNWSEYEVYETVAPVKKAPSKFGFSLRSQEKMSKVKSEIYCFHFCVEDGGVLNHWITAIRNAKKRKFLEDHPEYAQGKNLKLSAEASVLKSFRDALADKPKKVQGDPESVPPSVPHSSHTSPTHTPAPTPVPTPVPSYINPTPVPYVAPTPAFPSAAPIPPPKIIATQPLPPPVQDPYQFPEPTFDDDPAPAPAPMGNPALVGGVNIFGGFNPAAANLKKANPPIPQPQPVSNPSAKPSAPLPPPRAMSPPPPSRTMSPPPPVRAMSPPPPSRAMSPPPPSRGMPSSPPPVRAMPSSPPPARAISPPVIKPSPVPVVSLPASIAQRPAIPSAASKPPMPGAPPPAVPSAASKPTMPNAPPPSVPPPTSKPTMPNAPPPSVPPPTSKPTMPNVPPPVIPSAASKPTLGGPPSIPPPTSKPTMPNVPPPVIPSAASKPNFAAPVPTPAPAPAAPKPNLASPPTAAKPNFGAPAPAPAPVPAGPPKVNASNKPKLEAQSSQEDELQARMRKIAARNLAD